MFIKILVMTVTYVTAALLFYYALSIGANASQVAPILQSAVITTVILAAIFLKERDKLLKKLIAALMVMIGVFLIA